MTFSDLLQLASERLGVEIEDAGGAAGVAIDGAPVVLQDAGDLLLLRADLGAIPAEGRITVDASRLGDKSIVHVLARVTGTQTLAIPDKIDRETYNAFLALKAGPQREAYLDSIRPRLSKASYNAAVSRLDDVIAHIENMPADRIIENRDGRNGWLDADEAPLGTGKVTVQKHGGQEKRLGGEIAKDVNDLLCPSIFARDGIDKLFA